MPLEVEKLTKASSMNTIREAINASYAVCMKEPAKAGESVKDHQSRCGGMIYSMVEEHTGKKMKRK